jgi:hypothetical protein
VGDATTLNQSQITQGKNINANNNDSSIYTSISPFKENGQGLAIKNIQTSPKGMSKKFKIFPTNKEREFLNYYNSTENIIKSKDFKYIQFIGKKLLTTPEINKIIKDRIKECEDNLMIKRSIDINRHNFEIDTEKCCVDRNNPYLLKPTFNFNQNDKFFKTRHYFSLFLKGMTKALINGRAEKRLKKLKEMVSQNNIKTSTDFGNYMEKEWMEYFTRDQENDKESGPKLKFISPAALSREEVYLTNDYSIEALKQTIAHENNITLDELREFNKLERNDLEVIGYKEFRSPGISAYDISTQDNIFSTCADNETQFRSERGYSEI